MHNHKEFTQLVLTMLDAVEALEYWSVQNKDQLLDEIAEVKEKVDTLADAAWRVK